MTIEIRTQKKLIMGKPHRKILSFKMLKKRDLPEEYVNNSPAIYCGIEYQIINPNHIFVVKHTDGITSNITKNSTISEDVFQRIIQTARQAGQILHFINKKNKEKYPEHFAREIETIKI